MSDQELVMHSYLNGIKTGFNLAMTELYRLEAGDSRGLYAYELAQHLDSVMEQKLKEIAQRYYPEVSQNER